MSFNNFGRGRGFGPRGSRVAFGRPRFLRPPYRHVGPPRPGHPTSFGMPWQPNNMFLQPHLLQSNLQFRPGGRRKRLCSFDVRFPAPNRLSLLPDYEDDFVLPSNSLQIANKQAGTMPQIPLPGSEEERQQKIIETTDRIKQKLSCFNRNEMTNMRSDDIPLLPSILENDCIENRDITVLRYEQPELNLTYNDMKDIGKINSANPKCDDLEHATDIFNVTNNTNNDVILDENKNGSQQVIEVIPNNQITNLKNLSPNNEVKKIDEWEHQKSIEDSHNLEQSDLHENSHVENESLEVDQYQYNARLTNILQDQCDQQQIIPQKIDIHPTDVMDEEDVSETLNLQNMSFPTNLVNEEEPVTNFEVRENTSNSDFHAGNSSSNNCALSQSALTDVPILNNITLDNRLPRTQENSFHNTPPKLSPHIEQELPIDFDPSTPPPILLKQEQPCALPPLPIPDLPPLFDPTEPPPNMRYLLESKISHKNANHAWGINAQNPVPIVYNNMEMYTELNAHGGFTSQKLLLEMSSQSTGFFSPQIDKINFPPLFSMPPSGLPGINANVSLPQIVPCDTYIPSSSPPDILTSSDCNVNKDDCMNDMQEALKFAKQMTNITKNNDERSKSDPKSDSRTQFNSVGDIESIALPPGKPKAKIKKLKVKRHDMHSKRLLPKEQVISDHQSSEETIVQDVNVKFTNASLMNEQDRPKVVFNLNNKMKKVDAKTAWRENINETKCEKRNGMTPPVESEKTYASSSITRKSFENTLRRNEEEDRNLKKNKNSSESIAPSESIVNQDTLSHKKMQKNVHAERLQHSSVLIYPKIDTQKCRDRVEKNESSSSEASWKNKIIARFLKMSKNDIYNMVNNTSLRKFDVIMKRLVKEKRPTMSLEMRHAQDKKMKLYDQQEFMKQLNTMLDTDTIVSITDLPTEFIQHLNGVLQLDKESDNHTESAAASSNQTSHSGDTNHTLNPTIHTIEHVNRTAASNDVSQEYITNKSHVKVMSHDKDAQAHNTKNNDLNLKNDISNTIAYNNTNVNSNLLTLQHDLDDIFSEVTKKIQTPAIVKEHKHCSAVQRSTKKVDNDGSLKNVQKEILLADDKVHRMENCVHWIEKCDRWKRKEREDPYAYRNLTKEEWQAKYGTQASSISSSTAIKKDANDKNLPKMVYAKDTYPRRRHSSESSRYINTRCSRALEKDKHTQSRRHSDDRRRTAEYSWDNNDHSDNCDSSSSNSSSSSSSSSNSNSNSSSSSSNDSSNNREKNVTKLLRVIKEKEKVAKKMSLNETIRDEVNAEIERERKQKSKKLRRNHKNARSQIKKKACQNKKKHSNKTINPPDSFSSKGSDEEATRLLTENEIKKEIIENQITQKVLIKEELDIGQDDNTGDAREYSNTLSHVVDENKATYLLSKSHGKLESPSSAQATPVTIVNITQSHAEDRSPIDRKPTASPTQPKTKAQLKQMPETADVNDNKVCLNTFTCVPKDWSIINTTNISECSENLDKSYQATDVDYDQDKTEISSAINNFTNQNDIIDNTVHIPCDVSNKSGTSQRVDETVCTFIGSSSNTNNVRGENKISTFVNESNLASTVAVSSLVSNTPTTSTITQKHETCKKIDINTYFKRKIQCRMNEVEKSKRSTNNSVISTQNLLSTPKITELKTAINKSTSMSTCHSSIQDPQVIFPVKLTVTSCSTVSKDNVVQTTLKKNIQQKERKMMKKPKVVKTALKCEKGLNSVINSDIVIRKINRSKPKNKTWFIANTSINSLSNVATTNTTSSKSKKHSEIEPNVTDKTLESKILSDPKKFKNIRSEGSKELKLKEMVKIQKTKNKPTITSKSTGLILKELYNSLEQSIEAENTKGTDNISDISKIKFERTAQLIRSCESKINDNNTEIESSTISLDNIDNNNIELPHNINKVKVCSLNSEFIDQVNAKKATENNIESIDASEQLSSETVQDEKVYLEHDTANIEVANKKSQSVREISSVALKVGVSTASKIVPEIKISNGIQKISKKDFFASNENQIRIEKSDNQNLSEDTNDPASIKERDMSSITELDMTSHRLDDVDTQDKEDQLLINTCEINNINHTKEGDMKSDVLNDTYKSMNANEDNSLLRKTQSSMSSNNNFEEQQSTHNDISCPDSVDSPFKGFLEETMIDFEQSNLFNLSLNEIDANKKNKLFSDDCNVNCAIHIDDRKEIQVEEQSNYETLQSVTNYANDMSNNNKNFINNEHFNFDNTLLASDKECTSSEKNNKSDLMANESKKRYVKKTSSGIAMTALHDKDDNDGSTDESSKTEKQLMNEERYTESNTELAIKESIFINEEEIQDETRSRDLTSKLTTTTDPSLSDALDAAISDDALRLPESQGAEHLNNHIYLETNMSPEKNSCDKLPDFDSDEHLNNMFYLDDPLQSTTTFDNKDDVSAHFSVHQRSLRYDITSAVTPETTMIASCADLSHDRTQKPEQCKFDFKHISSMDNDLITGVSVERSPIIADTPRTLNIPTKAALKEAATSLFMKSPNNMPTATEEAALGILQQTQQNETDVNYSTSTWHVDKLINNAQTHPLETYNNTTIVTKDFINVNSISSTQNSTSDRRIHKEINIDQNKSLTCSFNMEKCFHINLQRNPVVELRKMKELDRMMEKKAQENSEKTKDNVYKDQKKCKDIILHKLKDKRQMKHRSKRTANEDSLAKKLKDVKQSGKIIGATREAILSRMLEIDMEMHKLAMEKLKLHEMLQDNASSTENTAANSSAVSRTKKDDTASIQPEILPTLTPQLARNAETSRTKQDKHASASKQRSIKQRKRLASHNLEDGDIMRYTQRKMPVIMWKKKPCLERPVRREEKEEEEKNLDEKTEQWTSTIRMSEKANNSVDIPEDASQKLEASATIHHDHRVQEIAIKTDKKTCDTEKFSGLTICSDKSASDKQGGYSSERQDFNERESEHVKHFDVDERNDVLAPSKTARTNSYSSSIQVHSTPEPLSIYSDDSTWDSLVQNTVSEMHENRKATGLALLHELQKKDRARTRKMKAMVRRKKKKQLNNFLKKVNNLTMEEEELPLSKLYIKKLQQKRDLLDSLSQKKEDIIAAVDPQIFNNIDVVINAVAKNRVEDLYDPSQSEVPTCDIPTASNISSISQPDKHEFYVDVEANANSDWPCREKENVEEVALQQDSNDMVGTNGLNHIFNAVNQNKVTFYDERNVEPDSSITPEETLMESHSSDCERIVRPKDLNNIPSRNFDIKVSVPKTLIKDDFSLRLLQKFAEKKQTETGDVSTGLVDSTTNTFSNNFEILEKDKNSRNTSQTKSIVGKNEREEVSETKIIEKNEYEADTNDNKRTVYELQNQETTDNVVRNARFTSQSDTAKSKYCDATKNKDSGNSVAPNQCDKIAITDIEHDLNISNSIIEKTDTKRKKSDAKSEQLSNDATALRQDYPNVENTTIKKDERRRPESGLRMFEEIMDHDQNTGSSIPVDQASERSEESHEMSREHSPSLERTSVSTFSFNKVIAKSGETNKRCRRKCSMSTPVRRSIRCSNENVKPNKVNEADTNSNSSEQESCVHERDLTTCHRSRSPTCTIRDERIVNNIKKNRIVQKVQNPSTLIVPIGAEMKVENSVKQCATEIMESTVSQNKTMLIGRKRKEYTKWQMMNCKVILVDCKYFLKQDVNPEVLGRLGITAINPYVSNDISTCTQRIAYDQDTAVISATVSEKSSFLQDKFYDKDRPDIAILEDKPIKKSNDDDLIQESTSHVIDIDNDQQEESTRTQYTIHKGPILDIKIFENSFLAASEDGKIYRYSQTSNGILNIYKGHKSAVTCLHIYKSDVAGINKEFMYSGSLDGTLRCYNITTGALIKKPTQINSPIQCMDQAWGMIFIGTKSGYVSRFHIKTSAIKGGSIEFSESSVLALKATNEGARRILIVASRSQPIIIRDAQTGLFLRTISGQKNHTVYSLMRHHNLIYCGTSSTSINVFDFTTGEQTIQYVAGVGIVCMRLHGQLLFAGCYDGNIYVFDTRSHKLVCSIPGPGNMLLSIEVVHNKIIAGSKDKRLHSWEMPTQVRALL